MPFPDARGPAGLVTAQVKQRPPPPSTLVDVPPGANAALLRALDKDRGARPADVGAFAASLRSCD